MNTYIITDTHLGQEKIKQYCGRPDNFEEQILDNLPRLKSDDVFIHCGDVAFGEESEWNRKLMKKLGRSGNRILVRGNHDTKTNSWYYKCGWTSVVKEYPYVSKKGIRVLFTHEAVPMKNSIHQINICGHLHNKPLNEVYQETQDMLTDGKHYVLVLENNKYKTWDLDKLMNKLIHH